MSADIAHRGIVKSIGDNWITVSITDNQDCEGCKVALVCGSGASREQLRLPVSAPREFHVGQEIEAVATGRSPWIAITTGLILPSSLLIAAVMLTIWLGGGEGLAATVGVLILIPYFLTLYLLRHKLTSSLSWDVKPINNQ